MCLQVEPLRTAQGSVPCRQEERVWRQKQLAGRLALVQPQVLLALGPQVAWAGQVSQA